MLNCGWDQLLFMCRGNVNVTSSVSIARVEEYEAIVSVLFEVEGVKSTDGCGDAGLGGEGGGKCVGFGLRELVELLVVGEAGTDSEELEDVGVGADSDELDTDEVPLDVGVATDVVV